VSFQNPSQTASGRTEDFRLQIARGHVANHNFINKFGYSEAVGTTFELITLSGAPITYVDSAFAAVVVSDEAQDNASGTGARTVRVVGCDDDLVIAQEVVTLNGTNSVTTTQLFRRVFRMSVETAGSGGKSAGTITASLDGNEQVRVDPAYDNQSLHAAYTVPSTATGYITRVHITAGKENKPGMAGIFVRDNNVADSVFQIKNLIETYRNSVETNFPVPIRVQGGSDIELRGKNLGADSISMGGVFDMIVIEGVDNTIGTSGVLG